LCLVQSDVFVLIFGIATIATLPDPDATTRPVFVGARVYSLFVLRGVYTMATI
jgi:hypothetical protein